MWHRAAWPSDHSRAVSVVPMPSVAGSATIISCRRVLAVATALARAASRSPDGCVDVEGGHGADRRGAGNLACRVAPHAVRHREQVGPRIRRVLVPLAEEADVRTYRVAEY